MKIMRRNKNKDRKDFTHSPKQTVVRYDCYARGHVTSLTANRHLDVTYFEPRSQFIRMNIVKWGLWETRWVFGFQEVVHDGLTWSTHRISFHFLSVVGNKSHEWNSTDQGNPTFYAVYVSSSSLSFFLTGKLSRSWITVIASPSFTINKINVISKLKETQRGMKNASWEKAKR